MSFCANDLVTLATAWTVGYYRIFEMGSASRRGRRSKRGSTLRSTANKKASNARWNAAIARSLHDNSAQCLGNT